MLKGLDNVSLKIVIEYTHGTLKGELNLTHTHRAVFVVIKHTQAYNLLFVGMLTITF